MNLEQIVAQRQLHSAYIRAANTERAAREAAEQLRRAAAQVAPKKPKPQPMPKARAAPKLSDAQRVAKLEAKLAAILKPYRGNRPLAVIAAEHENQRAVDAKRSEELRRMDEAFGLLNVEMAAHSSPTGARAYGAVARPTTHTMPKPAANGGTDSRTPQQRLLDSRMGLDSTSTPHVEHTDHRSTFSFR